MFKHDLTQLDDLKLTQEEIVDMWHEIDLKPLAISWQDFEYLKIMQTYLNEKESGNILFKCFQYPENKTLDTLINLIEYDSALYTPLFFEQCICSMKDYIKEMHVINEDLSDVKNNYELLESVTLDGYFAQTLYHCGTYKHFYEDHTVEAAKKLAMNFYYQLFQDNYDEIICIHTTQSWAKWFEGVVWDLTYLMIDVKKRRIWLLALTDSD